MALSQTVGFDRPIRVTVWHEYRHELKHKVVQKVYPDGMHTVIGAGIKEWLGNNVEIRMATLDQPEHGLTEEVLENTDVMTWWGHMAHKEVSDAVATKVQERVLQGMGIVFLHSAHFAKPFIRLMGTSCSLTWRESGEKERIWCVNPGHEIADGVGPQFVIEHEEMYGELFDIPTPDELVFLSWFEGGNVFRSGCCWTRGKGRVFYFRPGHEVFPTYYHPQVRRVIANAVRWAAPRSRAPYQLTCPNEKVSLSPISTVHVVDEAVHKA